MPTTTIAVALVVLSSVLVAPARADVIETCPDGQRYESNPVPEGAMHHAGGRCVDDPSARGGCAVGQSGEPTLALVVLGALALVVIRRRSIA